MSAQEQLPTIELAFDIDDLDLGEVADLAGVLGLGLDEMDRLANPTPAMLPAMLWIVQRRKDATYTYEQARKIKLSQLRQPAAAEVPAGAAPAAPAAKAPAGYRRGNARRRRR